LLDQGHTGFALRLLAALAGCLALTLGGVAHEIPNDVKINAFVKPEVNRLELLVRLPLASAIDVEFPTRGGGYLDVSRADDALLSAAKLYVSDNLAVFENDVALPPPRILSAIASLPSDRSFVSFEDALSHVHGSRLADQQDLYWSQLMLDVLLEYPITSERSQFAISFQVDRLGRNVTTALRFLAPGGVTRAFEYQGDPGTIHLDPSWRQAALSFIVAGFWHILEGTDHLLFLACLVIPFRRLRPLLIIITSFTVAHSITLFASAFGFVPDALWFPPLIETLIAITIVYMALENIVYAAMGSDPKGVISRRWIMAFVFGLVHGFGFSFALRETLQFAGDHLLTSLLAFNLGVEIGQLAVLLVLIPALGLLFRHVLPERLGIIIISALVAHTAWHWMLERAEQLARFPLPRLDAAFAASVMRGLILALLLAAGLWLVSGWLKRWMRPDSAPIPEPVNRQPGPPGR
jgi:hypothetical protein